MHTVSRRSHCLFISTHYLYFAILFILFHTNYYSSYLLSLLPIPILLSQMALSFISFSHSLILSFRSFLSFLTLPIYTHLYPSKLIYIYLYLSIPIYTCIYSLYCLPIYSLYCLPTYSLSYDLHGTRHSVSID